MGGRGSSGSRTQEAARPAPPAVTPPPPRRVAPPVAPPAPVAPPQPAGYRVTYEPGAKLGAKELFGREIADKDLAELGGALPGSTVLIQSRAGMLNIRVSGPHLDSYSYRHIRKDNGKLVMGNDYLRVARTERRSGIGTKIFATQVSAARKLGVDEIRVHAAKGAGFNGYYTWARLGYKLNVNTNTRRLAQAQGFGKVVSTHDLMTKPGGAEFWKAYGHDTTGSFSLKDSAKSMEVFKAYAASKGIRV